VVLVAIFHNLNFDLHCWHVMYMFLPGISVDNWVSPHSSVAVCAFVRPKHDVHRVSQRGPIRSSHVWLRPVSVMDFGMIWVHPRFHVLW
jgi:hypothetical protein